MSKKVIIIGDSGDMKLAESHKKEYGKITIVHEDNAKEDRRFIGAIPQRGVVFVKHPYMDCYVANNNDLDYNICAAMVGELKIFAQKLGVKYIWFTITVKSKRLFSNKVELTVSQGETKGKASSKYEKQVSLFAKLSEGQNFQRNNDLLSEEEFKDAKLFFEKSDLFKYCDPSRTAESMLMGRNPETETKSMSFVQVIDKTINLNEDLSIALSYKKASMLKASGAYAQNRSFSKHFHIEMYCDFLTNHEQSPINMLGNMIRPEDSDEIISQ